MQNVAKYVVGFILLMAISSCSEDFKTGANYKELTVVYGLLNKSDSAHYIKITRGFFDESGNNLAGAKQPDSIYHPNLLVTVKELNSAGSVIQTYTLNKVSLKAEGIVKDSGTFANDPAYAYKFKAELNPNYKYKLEVVNQNTGKLVYDTTEVLNTDAVAFNVSYPVSGGALNFSDKASVTEFIFTPPKYSAIVEMYMKFYYTEEESTTSGINVKDKIAYLPIFTKKQVLGSGEIEMRHTFGNSSFIGLLSSAIGSAPSNVSRYVDTPDVVFYVGGKEIATYIAVTNAQGGLTADQIKPLYTSLAGDNVAGILSSRGIRSVNGLPFSKTTIDMLVGDIAAKDLRIVGKSKK